MHELLISGIECYAFHGCLSEEEAIGCKYTIDVHFITDLQHAIANDDLSQTIDYVLVNKLVKQEMAVRSRLIEHVAGRIHTVLQKQFIGCDQIKVSVTKHQPPVFGFINKAVFTIS